MACEEWRDGLRNTSARTAREEKESTLMLDGAGARLTSRSVRVEGSWTRTGTAVKPYRRPAWSDQTSMRVG
jgi:hypothetical protein